MNIVILLLLIMTLPIPLQSEAAEVKLQNNELILGEGNNKIKIEDMTSIIKNGKLQEAFIKTDISPPYSSSNESCKTDKNCEANQKYNEYALENFTAGETLEETKGIIKISFPAASGLGQVWMASGSSCPTPNWKMDDDLDQEIIVETSKAEGNKCNVCWKIRKNKCERHGCFLN